MLAHVIVTVSDFTRSIAFYAQALRPLGITDFLTIKARMVTQISKASEMTDASSSGSKRGGQSGCRSLRFCRQKPCGVECLLYSCNSSGRTGEKLHLALQLQYHPDYYATWLLDPDGHDVEVANKTGQID